MKGKKTVAAQCAQWVRDWKDVIALLDVAENRIAFSWTKVHELVASYPSSDLWIQHRQLLERKS